MTKKIIFILFNVIAIIAALYFSISTYLTYKQDYVDICVASHNIAQRTKISFSDLEVKRLPKQYLGNDVYTLKEDIIDKYVKLSCMIPKGSYFYKGFLQEDIKDLSHTLLRQGEVNYDIYTSEVKVNSASLQTGMYVDIYLTVSSNKETVDSGLLVENCRITGLYDNQGKQVQSFDNESRVSIISLAIMKEDVSYLNKALSLGNMSLIVNNTTYAINSSSNLVKDSEVFKYLQ